MKGVVRPPRWKLGAVLGVVSGVLTQLLLKDVWASLFAIVAFGALAAFGAIGKGGVADEAWTDSAGDGDGGGD